MRSLKEIMFEIIGEGDLQKGNYASVERSIAERLSRDPDDYSANYLLAYKSTLEKDYQNGFALYRNLLLSHRVPLQHQKWFIGWLVANVDLWQRHEYGDIEIRTRELIRLTTNRRLVGELNWWLWQALYYSEKFEEMLSVTTASALKHMNRTRRMIVARVRSYALNKVGHFEEALTEIEGLLPQVSERKYQIELLKYKCEALEKLGRSNEALRECERLKTLGVNDDFVRSRIQHGEPDR